MTGIVVLLSARWRDISHCPGRVDRCGACNQIKNAYIKRVESLRGWRVASLTMQIARSGLSCMTSWNLSEG